MKGTEIGKTILQMPCPFYSPQQLVERCLCTGCEYAGCQFGSSRARCIGLAPNARITRQALQRLASLDAQSYRIEEITGRRGEISNIKGLEHATQLTELRLNFHQIQDIAPLAGLIQLEDLDIAGNPITNFRPLARLIQLRTLSVSVDRVSDLHQHIVDLARLKSLEFTGGPLPDLHLLNTLPHLESLGLNFDAVNDLNLQSLMGLIQLKSLTIWESQVRDVSPLAKNDAFRRVVSCSA